jgi:hypothetical protein
MKGQRIGRKSEAGADIAGRHAVGPCLDQKPENVEAIVLRQCRQNGDRILLFHISMIIEINADGQAAVGSYSAGDRDLLILY